MCDHNQRESAMITDRDGIEPSSDLPASLDGLDGQSGIGRRQSAPRWKARPDGDFHRVVRIVLSAPLAGPSRDIALEHLRAYPRRVTRQATTLEQFARPDLAAATRTARRSIAHANHTWLAAQPPRRFLRRTPAAEPRDLVGAWVPHVDELAGLLGALADHVDVALPLVDEAGHACDVVAAVGAKCEAERPDLAPVCRDLVAQASSAYTQVRTLTQVLGGRTRLLRECVHRSRSVLSLAQSGQIVLADAHAALADAFVLAATPIKE